MLRAGLAACRNAHSLRALAATPLPGHAAALLMHADPYQSPTCTPAASVKRCRAAAAAMRLLRTLCEDAEARPAAAAAAVAGGRAGGAAGLASLVGMLERSDGSGEVVCHLLLNKARSVAGCMDPHNWSAAHRELRYVIM